MSATVFGDAVSFYSSVGDAELAPPTATEVPNESATTEAEEEATMEGSSFQVELAMCECCGLTEECTPEYIALVRERHHGRWICGLCAEAVQDEIYRAEVLITTEEALKRHMTFRSSPPPANPTGHLISAVRQLVRRSFDSPRGLRSTPNSPRGKSDDEVVGPRTSLARSGSCFPALAG